jgi:serine/threonine-protein kinase RsbW
MPTSTTYSIESDFEEVSYLGQAIHKLVAIAGMDEVDSARFELGVVEALNNVIEHGYQLQPNHKIKVIFEPSKNYVVIHIVDTGIAMGQSLFSDKENQKEVKEHIVLEDIPEGGWGLALIKSIMDEVSYKSENGINHLTLLKKMNR